MQVRLRVTNHKPWKDEAVGKAVSFGKEAATRPESMAQVLRKRIGMKLKGERQFYLLDNPCPSQMALRPLS
jgi:hypothetical protein